MQRVLSKNDKVVDLLSKLAEAEVKEIAVDSQHIAATKNWVVRQFYDYGLADAKRHLEIATRIRDWVHQGKPEIGVFDVEMNVLEREADSESDVGGLVSELLSLVDDPDIRALLEGISADERRHEDGLRSLRERVMAGK